MEYLMINNRVTFNGFEVIVKEVKQNSIIAYIIEDKITKELNIDLLTRIELTENILSNKLCFTKRNLFIGKEKIDDYIKYIESESNKYYFTYNLQDNKFCILDESNKMILESFNVKYLDELQNLCNVKCNINIYD